jgi:aminopeptidase N
MHEVGHNWFYGALGFNERKYPYLDEGINTFSEFRYMNTKYPQLKLYNFLWNNVKLGRILNLDDFPSPSFKYNSFLLAARSNTDQPLNLSSEKYSAMNYGLVVYDKSALAFNYLMQYLGEENFNSVMQDFFQQWKFRHPGPEDLQQAFVTSCKEDLSWFFDDLLTQRN